jgi:putative modified peptide
MRSQHVGKIVATVSAVHIAARRGTQTRGNMATNPTSLPQNVVATLLDKLGSDDAFRELFQQTPLAALKAAGATQEEAEGCAHCLKVSKLADKATIVASHQALQAMLTASMAFQPHKLGIR